MRTETLLEGLCPRCLATATLFERADGPGGVVTGFEDYELIDELGRGGMGVVYLARQRSLDRLVAIKLLTKGAAGRAATEARFLHEARQAARLRHPHIVAIHEVGRHAQQPFYSMEFIDGEDLSVRVARQRPSAREAAELVMKTARAVQYAHDCSLVHRDIKPANILVDETGAPHLTDFGLAAALDGRSGFTCVGEVLGSPGYMAPELLRGEGTAASDVYGLGGALYFALTGHAPFEADDLPQLLAAIERHDLRPPRRHDASIPLDLETIALHALAANPKQRYASAGALADDLDRWMSDRPIHARPVGTLGRVWRWMRRNPSLAAASLALVIAGGGGGALSFWQWRRAEGARAASAAHLYSADLRVASDALQRGDLGQARRVLEQTPRELRDFAWGLLWPLTKGGAEAELGRAKWTVTHLAVSADRAWGASASQDDVVQLWDLEHGAAAGELPGTDVSWWTAFSPDGQELFTGDQRSVKRWHVATRTLIAEYPGCSGVLSPDGRTLYTCDGHPLASEGSAGTVRAWNVSDGALLFTLADPARRMALSPDGMRLVVSDGRESLAVFDARDGSRMGAAVALNDGVWQLGFSPDGSSVLASGWSRAVRIFQIAELAKPPRLLEHPLATWGFAFSPDGRMLAVGCSDRQVHVWDTGDWRKLETRAGHHDEVWSVAWQSDGRLLSSGRDPRVLRWPAKETNEARWLRHADGSYYLAWLSGGRLAALHADAAGEVSTVIASARGPSEKAVFAGECPLGFDAGRNRLWLWAGGGELRVRDVEGKSAPERVVLALAPGERIRETPFFDSAAGVVWAALEDGAWVMHALDGKRIARRDAVEVVRPWSAALSPDRTTFVWGGANEELYWMDLRNGRRDVLRGHRYQVSSVVFAKDGRWFVSGGVDGRLLMWETATGRRIRELGQHPTSVGRMALSPDGAVLVSHEVGLGARLWHPATGREVGFVAAPGQGWDHWIGISPDARWLAVRTGGSAIEIFPAADADGSEP